MRNVHAEDAGKVAFQERYWTVPFLLRMMNRVDSAADDAPDVAVALATPLPALARRIPVRPGAQYYRSSAECRDFCLLAEACRFHALAAAGSLEDALRLASEAMRALDQPGTDRFVQAEVRRRAAYVAVELGSFEQARKLAQEAAEIFHEEKNLEYAALAHIRLGNALNLGKGAGSGIMEYARALYFATQTKSDRSKRAVAAAAGNLARDSLFVTHLSKDVYRWIAAAKEAMKGRPASVPKLKVAWVEALASYRFGLGRYAATHLENVRDRLVRLGALADAVSCTADLVTVVTEYEPEILSQVVGRSVEVLKRATPDQIAVAALNEWAERPSDVVLLRRLLQSTEKSESS